MLPASFLALLLATAQAANGPASQGPVQPAPAVDGVDAGSYDLVLDGGEVDFYPDAGVRVGPGWLTFSGNRVLPDEVYQVELDLAADATPSQELTADIEQRVYKYLRRTGYDLATVTATFKDGQVHVQIDEGRLEKIVFRGGLTVQTMQFKLALYVEQDVFNRFTLQRQIDRLSKSIGLHIVRWALVPTANPDHIGWQLTSMPEIAGIELVHEREPYELHFFFEEHDWNEGMGADIRSSYLDGLEIGINRQGKSLLLNGDKWRVAASAGAGIRKRILDDSFYPAFSRAFVEGKWIAPTVADIVEPSLWATSTMIGRNRPDLWVENYNEASAILSGHLKVHFGHGVSLAFGVGGEWRDIFGLHFSIIQDKKKTKMEEEDVRQEVRIRGFTELRGYWAISSDPERPDRSHFLSVGTRFYFGTDPYNKDPTTKSFDYKPYGWVYEKYQKVFSMGWNDLWLKSNGRLAWGDVAFHDEQPLAEYLRGVFGIIWVRKGINFSAEYRFSITRDVIKLSFFVETAFWGQIPNRVGVPPSTAGFPDTTISGRKFIGEDVRAGITGGPGLHILFQGDFQLDIYGSFGVASPRYQDLKSLFGTTFNFGAVVILNKVF